MGKNGTTALVGLTLISPNTICCLCGSKLTVRKDRPSVVVMYTESIGTIAAKHYRKVCSRARTGCSFVQHYGFYTKGQYQIKHLCGTGIYLIMMKNGACYTCRGRCYTL